MLSPPFARAKGCQRLVETFWKTAEETGRLRIDNHCRILNVVKTPVERSELPPEIELLFARLVPYEFFERDPQSGRLREFDEAFGETAKQHFYERVYDVAFEISQVLKHFGRDSGMAEEKSAAGKTVFLAATTSDLEPYRDQLRRELMELGHDVLPKQPLPLAASELASVARACLQHCDLAIHFVGEYYGLVPEATELSVVALQNQVAAELSAESGLERLIWMPRGQRPRDERQAAFIRELERDPAIHRGAELIVDTLDNLKVLLRSRWRREAASSGGPSTEKPLNGTPRVYLICDQRDEQAIEPLEDFRFLAIVGTSGSGKSSLVRAGLIPALHRGTMTQAGSTWEVVVLRPGGNPVTNLARALLGADLYDQQDPESLPRLRATLNRSLYGLVEAVKQSDQVDSATNLLVVVDQFEEVFRYRQQSAQSEETTSAFVSLLLAAAQQQQQRIYVTITMRSDYLGDCSHLPGLAEAVNRGEYLIPRLMRDQQRDAIEKPVGVGGARIAPRLVQRMLNDVGDDLDQLPVLQHALLRSWDAWSHTRADDEPLDLPHYEATGGMEEALSRHADEVYNSLPDEAHRRVCERLFKSLTEQGADNRGVRRPTRLEELQRISGANRSTVTAVIDAFRAPGVTFLMPTLDQELADRTVIDLSHESLMRVWKRLRAWAQEEARSARVYRRLAESAALWQEGKASLYHDPDLQIALRWRDTSEPNSAWAEQYAGRFEVATQFLDQSREAAETEAREKDAARQHELEQAHALAEAQRRRAEEQQRAAKRMKMLAAGIAAVALFAMVAFVVARAARRDAIQNAQLAEKSAELAQQNAELAQQNSKLAQQKERAATVAKAQLQQTLARSDFNVGVEKIQAGDGAGGLMHLARAMRTDERMWPAGVRAMSTLASGRFSLESLEPIKQKRVIVDHRFNDAEDLLFTWDIAKGVDLPAGEIPEGFVWNARTGGRLYQVAPGKRLEHPNWTEDGTLLFGYLPDEKMIQAWEARSGEKTGPAITVKDSVTDLRLGSDPEQGHLLLVRYNDGALQVWKAATGETLTPQLKRPASTGVWFGFSRNRRWVYSSYSDVVSVWDTVGGAPVQQFSVEPHGISNVYWSPDGVTVLVRAIDQKHVIWWPVGRANTESSWLQFDHKVDVAFLRDESKVVIVPQEEQPSASSVAVYDLETRQRTATIEPEGSVNRFVQPIDRPFDYRRGGAPNREHMYRFPIIGTVESNVVRIWDLRTGNQLQKIISPALLADATFSPEGRRVATTSEGHEVSIWDLFTGKPLLREPIRHQGSVTGPVFSADGERLVTHDAETGMVYVWNSRTGDLLAEPTRWPEGEDESRFHEFDVVAPHLRRGVNVVAAEVHQGYFTSSDIGFDLEIEAIGGLNDAIPAASVLEQVEEELGIPNELRSVLWTSRAARFRIAGKLDEASKALEQATRLGADNPGVTYQKALILHERGEEEAAYQAYIEAVKRAITLKSGAPSPFAVLLPKAIKEPLEPLLEATALGLAEAAGGVLLSETESRWLLRWSQALQPDGHEARRARAETLLKLEAVEEALSAADAALAADPPDATAAKLKVRHYKEWLSLKERCLRRLEKTDEADQARDELVAAPPRNPELTPKLVDLSEHYNASLYDQRGSHLSGPGLRMLPETFRPRNGIDFDLRGLIQLNSGVYPDDAPNAAVQGKDANAVADRQYPDQVTGIRVELKTRALHFLTSTIWGLASSGEQIARFVIHYEDGSQAEVPLRFEEDVINWSVQTQTTNPRRDAWLGRDPPCCLSDKTWENPHSDKQISHIDFISAKTTAAPFLVAITAE